MDDSADVKRPRGRPVKSASQQLAALQQQVKVLEAKVKEENRQARQKNAAAVRSLLAKEGLDVISPDKWRSALPQIKAMLGKA